MDSSRAELRKWEDNLNVSGLGVIVLGAWSAVRAIIEMFSNFKESANEIKDNMAGSDRMMGYVVMGVMIAIVLLLSLLILWIHVYVGLNAMKAARGQEHKRGYFAWAIIMLVLMVLSMAGYSDILDDLENIDTNIAAMLVDLATIYTFYLVIRSTKKMKQLNQNESTQGE